METVRVTKIEGQRQTDRQTDRHTDTDRYSHEHINHLCKYECVQYEWYD